MELSLTWLHNREDIVTGSVTFCPPGLNKNLTIENAQFNDSGVYTCIATANGQTAEQNISVMIVPGKMHTKTSKIHIYTS